MALIMFKRGEGLPPPLHPGEPGWSIDTKQLYIGTDYTSGGNILIGSGTDLEARVLAVENALIALGGNGVVRGGDIYIQETQPVEPKENDIWFDLGSIN